MHITFFNQKICSMKKFALLLTSLLLLGLSVAFAQTKSITGVVTSADDGATLPGVSVVVKGTTLGVVTDIDGKYNLDVPEDAQVLVFSYVGMKSIEENINGRTKVDVKLKADVVGVDEVMVVAYGTSKKSSFTGSASAIKADKLEAIQTSSVTKALDGLTAGVTVTSGSGQPGANASIRIRGFSTFNGDASPLIVVDGFPFGGNINSIPSSDIESMTVLKDASATALYGSRAANGVIIITTKRGKKGKSELTVKAVYGMSDRAIPEYDRVDPGTYYELMWEALRNFKLTENKTAAVAGQEASSELVGHLGGYNSFNVANNQLVDPTTGKLNASAQPLWNDNWQDEMFRNANRQDITVSASGGNDKSTYFIAGNYLKDEGIIKASKFDRFTIRLNADSQLKDWIKVGLNMSGSLSEQNFPQSSGSAYANSFMYARMVAPIYPVYVYDLDGKLQTDPAGNKLYDYGNTFGRSRSYSANSNPLGTIALDTRSYKRDVVTARGYVDMKITNELSFKVTGSADYYTYNSLVHQNSKYGDAEQFKGRSTRSNNRTLQFSANELLSYSKSFNGHSIDVLVGHENYQYKFNQLSATRTGFPFPGLVELDAAATAEGSGSYEHNYKIESYLAKIDYNFNDKYYLNANFRRDGNSKFNKDNRWGNFWSFGASWRLSEEAFLQGVSWLDLLRLRGSYGEQGNDGVGTYYAYQGLYDTGWNNLDFPGLLASRLATPELTWEAQKLLNIGVEAKMFDRVSLSFDYFIKKNDELLFDQPLPPSTGFSSIDANIASLQNRGFEIELDAMILKSKDFEWSTRLNLSHVKNEIKELPQEFISDGARRWEVGKSIFDFYIREYAGVDKETGNPLWYYDEIKLKADGTPEEDADGNPVKTGKKLTTDKYSDADRYFSGTAVPDFTGGLSNSFRYKGFDLNVLVTFRKGGKVLDGSYQNLMQSGADAGTNFHKDVLNRWTPDNKDTDVPKLNILDQDGNGTSTRFLLDGDYISIKNVSLGYNFPKHLISRWGFSNLRVFVIGDNLKVFNKLKGLDTNQSYNGETGNDYTPLRTVSFGLEVKF
jgi:TonB-linked SusC/RagA family outer membrane protein